MEALLDMVHKVAKELAELYEEQAEAITQRDRQQEGELEEKIQELVLYRAHLEYRIEEEQKCIAQAAEQGPREDVAISYISSWLKPIPADELACIGLYGRLWNQKMGVTSCLLVMPAPGAFFQIIEGPEAAVEELFRKISTDQRHGRVTLLLREKLTKRRFEKWPLRLKVLEDVEGVLHNHISELLAHLMDSHALADCYAPAPVSAQLISGSDPLACPGARNETVVAFLGLRSLTTGSLRQLGDAAAGAKGGLLAGITSAVVASTHRHAAPA